MVICNSKHDILDYKGIKFMTVTSDVCREVVFLDDFCSNLPNVRQLGGSPSVTVIYLS